MTRRDTYNRDLNIIVALCALTYAVVMFAAALGAYE